MDKEQINELKPGDEVLIRCSFNKIKENGDFQVSYLLTTVRGKLYWYRTAVHPSAVTIKSPPTHDPTRLFKKGDKVRVVAWNGRDIPRVGHVGYVVANEHNSKVELAIDGWTNDVFYPACHLELVTPVEEPFYVERQGEKSGGLCYTVRKDDGWVESTFYFGKGRSRDEQQAKAAAEAERDRLNAKHRKEAANG